MLLSFARALIMELPELYYLLLVVVLDIVVCWCYCIFAAIVVVVDVER